MPLNSVGSENVLVFVYIVQSMYFIYVLLFQLLFFPGYSCVFLVSEHHCFKSSGEGGCGTYVSWYGVMGFSSGMGGGGCVLVGLDFYLAALAFQWCGPVKDGRRLSKD